MNKKNCKQELIDITISLINENHGDVNKVIDEFLNDFNLEENRY